METKQVNEIKLNQIRESRLTRYKHLNMFSEKKGGKNLLGQEKKYSNMKIENTYSEKNRKMLATGYKKEAQTIFNQTEK